MRRAYRDHARCDAGGGLPCRGAGLMAEILPGSLSVARPNASRAGAFETFIQIAADGTVTAFNGHVDLGTGIRTALGQIVAEELEVSLARGAAVPGDPVLLRTQAPTVARETTQFSPVPLRRAAAQARHFLLARA